MSAAQKHYSPESEVTLTHLFGYELLNDPLLNK
jgi:hypothetical protein